VFIIHLRDVWHSEWSVDVHSESCIHGLYAQLEQLEQARQSQQSPSQVGQLVYSLNVGQHRVCM